MNDTDLIQSHLRLDAVLRPLVDELPYPEKRVHLSEIYHALLRSIVGQQVSTAAAAAIYGRFLALFQLESSDKLASPTPAVLAKADREELRAVGLSYSKADYVKAIGQYFLDKPHAHTSLPKLSNDELIAELTQIKGVGKWTVEMMLIFALGRHDVLPLDDLAIYQSMLELYTLDPTDSKRALKQQMEQIAMAWQPYRSHACLYLYAWRGAQKTKRKQ